MAIDTTVDNALSKWIEERKKYLHKRVLRLIALAQWDLYYSNMDGQDDDEDTDDGEKVVYPGFVAACWEISNGIENLPREVWVNIQWEGVEESEPQSDSYEDENPDYDPNDNNSEPFVTVTNEVDWSDYRKIEWGQIKAALVGGELAKYIH